MNLNPKTGKTSCGIHPNTSVPLTKRNDPLLPARVPDQSYVDRFALQTTYAIASSSLRPDKPFYDDKTPLKRNYTLLQPFKREGLGPGTSFLDNISNAPKRRSRDILFSTHRPTTTGDDGEMGVFPLAISPKSFWRSKTCLVSSLRRSARDSVRNKRGIALWRRSPPLQIPFCIECIETWP